MIKHYLKIEENYLLNLLSGVKKSEIRFNDRDYQRLDVVVFKTYDFERIVEHEFIIEHIHSGLGLKEGYIVLSLTHIGKLKVKTND